MTLAQTDQGIASLLGGIGVLELDRTDIHFHSVDAQRIRVTVTVRNRGPGRSSRTQALIQSAAFGAFVPWTPLTTLEIPPLESGQSVDVSAVVPRPASSPKGFFDDVPPVRPTAQRTGDDDRSRNRGRVSTMLITLVNAFFRSRQFPFSERDSKPVPAIPDLLLDAQPHWAGNINVLIGNKDVERHMSHAIAIKPGRLNLAAFFVGDCTPDEYQFELRGAGAEWEAGLYESADLQSCLVRREYQMQRSDWMKIARTQPVVLGVRPPQDCGREELEVHVCRRSTGQRAIVEFSLDPSAAGPGCYTV